MSELDLDHVSHFVPESDAASAVLERLGFTLTPLSAQSHRLSADGPLLPAGTANRCVMLEEGYLEFLTPTHDTPLANQLSAAMARYVGVHLIAFGTHTPDIDHARLAREGFEPLAPVALQRPISVAGGESTARFTVVRVPPGTMSEGRIQFCQHLTPELVWQTRWIRHRNGATALASVLLCVTDPQEAARRYARYAGLEAKPAGRGWRIDTSRGSLVFAGAEAFGSTLGLVPPALPWIAGYALDTRDFPATRAHLVGSGLSTRDLNDERVLVKLPPSLGGAIVFQRPGLPPLLF